MNKTSTNPYLRPLDSWRDITVWDMDTEQIMDDADARRALIKYRDTGVMSGTCLVDPSDLDGDCDGETCACCGGPAPEDIDWTGIDDDHDDAQDGCDEDA